MAKPDPTQPPKEVQVADFKRTSERKWLKCDKCKYEILKDPNGREYYHALKCPRSNGVDYRR
jgi:hypothetical protein